MRALGVFIFLIGSFFASIVRAQAVQAFPIFTGEAVTNTAARIEGTATFIVRIQSNDGLIQALDFTGFDTFNPAASRGVSGRAVQRRTSSLNDGVYDLASPGFLSDVNGQSELSLDTHFLAPTNLTDYTVTSPLTESGFQFFGFGPFPPSSTSVGWGMGGQGLRPNEGRLQGAWTIAPAAQSTIVDPIYAVAGGTTNVIRRALTDTGWQRFGFSVGVPTIPEPGTHIAATTLTLGLLSHQRMRTH